MFCYQYCILKCTYCVFVFQIYSLLRRRRPLVWMFSRATEWWDVTVPSFTTKQWVENISMSEETFLYLCNKMRPAMEREDTNICSCVPLKKETAIALWKLATGPEYRTVGHLFRVSRATVCQCMQDFCAAAETFLVPEQIRLPDQEKLRKWLTRRGSHSVLVLLMDHIYPF